MTTSPLVNTFAADQANEEAAVAKKLLGALVQPSQYVGEVISLRYTKALVQIHDFYRKKVGGIPPLAFLIATRVDPETPIRYKKRMPRSSCSESLTRRRFTTSRRRSAPVVKPPSA
jgi:hypothetical protein